MIKLAVFLAAALSAAVPAWAVNKCTGPDGKVMFQDAPCPGTGITVAEDLARKKEERERTLQELPKEGRKPYQRRCRADGQGCYAEK